jgi:hypothetical protein
MANGIHKTKGGQTMANPRQDNRPAHSIEDEAKRTVERTSEQTKRIGEASVKASEEVARASANLLQQNAEIFQRSWRFSADMATGLIGRSSEQLGRTLGLSGEEAQEATQRSARNLESVLYSASALAKGLNGASQEYLDFMRGQFAKSMDRMNELWRCRTPQDVAAIQSDFVREAVSDLFERNRRIADLSLRLADDAGSHIAQSMETARRAA